MSRRLVSSILAFCLVFAMLVGSASVVGAENTVAGEVSLGQGVGEITIKGNDGQTLVGKKFNVYPVLSSVEADDGSSIIYNINEDYSKVLYSTVESVTGKIPKTDYEVTYYISELNESEFRSFVEELRDAIVSENIDSSKYFTVDVKSVKSNNSIVLKGLKEGYYVVDEVSDVVGTHSASSLCMVNTVSPDVVINIKSDYPSVEKKIKEDDNGVSWNDIGDYEIGQTVPYKFTSNVPNMNGYSTYYYAWHDIMDEALTFNKDSVKITITDGTKEYDLTSREFNIVENTEGETFKVEITDLKSIVDREFEKIDDETGKQVYGQTVVVEYNATLNDRAYEDAGRPGFENDVRLEFSNDPDSDGQGKTGFTPWDTVVCFTYKLNVLKVNDKNNALKDAKFRLYRDEDCTDEVVLKDTNGGYVVVNNDSSAGVAPVDLVSDKDGKFTIIGLDQGNYWLKETEAPKGYRGIEKPIKLTITPEFTEDRDAYVKGEGATDKTLVGIDYNAEISDYVGIVLQTNKVALDSNVNEGVGNLTVVNFAGKRLPITGSSLTIILTGLGLATMLGAVIVGKKRKEEM